METLLSNEKQIEQYFSNDKLEDQNSKKEHDNERDAASAAFGGSKQFKSNRSALSKSGLNHTKDSSKEYNGRNVLDANERSGYVPTRTSMKNSRGQFDQKKNKDNSELLKSSGSQSGFAKRIMNQSQASKTSLNLKNNQIEHLVQRGLKRRETLDNQDA